VYERIKEMAEGRSLGIRIQGDITDRENREIIDLITDRERRCGAIRLLIVYDAAPGFMGAEDLYDNLRFAKLTSEKISRMAVVGERERENTWVGLFGLFGGIQTDYFTSGQLEEALHWLTESA